MTELSLPCIIQLPLTSSGHQRCVEHKLCRFLVEFLWKMGPFLLCEKSNNTLCYGKSFCELKWVIGTRLYNQGPRSGDFLCMRTHEETTAPYFPQLAKLDFYSQGTALNKSTLAFKLKPSLLIIFIPLELVTITFPFAAWLWVMNVAPPNRQAGTRLPVRMPDVTKKYHKHGCPLAFVSGGKIHSSSNYESRDLMHQYL